jgi:hypothetical protein
MRCLVGPRVAWSHFYLCRAMRLQQVYKYGTASARTSVPDASHRTGPQPSDFKMLGHQPSDRRV